MKAPFVLRAQIAWTVLTGRYRAISVGDCHEGTAYRVDIEPRSVSWWLARRDRRNTAAAKRAAYEKSKEIV